MLLPERAVVIEGEPRDCESAKFAIERIVSDFRRSQPIESKERQPDVELERPIMIFPNDDFMEQQTFGERNQIQPSPASKVRARLTARQSETKLKMDAEVILPPKEKELAVHDVKRTLPSIRKRSPSAERNRKIPKNLIPDVKPLIPDIICLDMTIYYEGSDKGCLNMERDTEGLSPDF